jgi:hypothetical protein
MRRATTITLVVMGGGALTLGTVAILRRPGPDPACNSAQSAPAATSCGSHGGAVGAGSGGRRGGQADADSAVGSTRGGFGESGGGHGGE